MRIAVLGAGSWGTALANHLCGAGHELVIWGPNQEDLDNIKTKGINERYFPGEKLANGLAVEKDLTLAVTKAEAIVFALPSFAMREVAENLKGRLAKETLLITCTKGLEENTHKQMSEILAEVFSENENISALSGPSFAYEVLKGLPTAVVLAAKNEQLAKKAASLFHQKNFRVYISNDLIGVELGGALKNVIALASGMSDGLGLGANARAALITRGLAELRRLVIACGGKAETVSGLSGLGDLLLTATGDLSRNRQVGLRLGKGEKLVEILKDLGQVAEGVETAKKALELAREKNVSVPITEEVCKVIAGEQNAKEALSALLSRQMKEE